MKYFHGEQPWGYDKHLSFFFQICDKLQNTNVYKDDLQRNSRKFHQRYWPNLKKKTYQTKAKGTEMPIPHEKTTVSLCPFGFVETDL